MTPPAADQSAELAARVRAAYAAETPLRIEGGGSKGFWGPAIAGDGLSVRGHAGIVSYEPSELVVTARAGTRLEEIEAALLDRRQMLAFEPPHFGPGATLGGTLACGLGGPRRPYAGAARDFVLGARIINGRGEGLRFGGQVMKNVAGYDVSRLMVGARGTLGVILEASLKVLPRPGRELTLILEASLDAAIETANRWAATPLPLSGACADGERLCLRLSGTETGVAAAARRVGGEPLEEGAGFWRSLAELDHPFFAGDEPLWRLSVPPLAPVSPPGGKWLIDWGGAQRWWRTRESAETIRRMAEAAGGHATLFRAPAPVANAFHPLAPGLVPAHRRLKHAFDPKRILNRDALYAGL